MPADLAKEHDIRIVPLDVRLGDWGPDEMRQIEPSEFWQRCAKTDRVARDLCAVSGRVRRELHTGRRRRMRRCRVPHALGRSLFDLPSRVRGRRRGARTHQGAGGGHSHSDPRAGDGRARGSQGRKDHRRPSKRGGGRTCGHP